MRTGEAFRGRNEFWVGCRDTQLTTDESSRACVDNLLSWDDESARSGTSLGWRVCRSVDWQHVHIDESTRAWAADARGSVDPALMNVPIGRKVVAALGCQLGPRRQAEQVSRCIWTPRIACRLCSRRLSRGGAYVENDIFGPLLPYYCVCSLVISNYVGFSSSQQKILTLQVEGSILAGMFHNP